MKKLLFTVAVITACLGAQAQSESSSKVKFSFGVDGAMPIGDFDETTGFGIGGSVQADYWLDEKIALTGSAGYLHYSGKDFEIAPGFTVEGEGFGIIPVLAGGKVMLGDQFFVSAQLGAAISTQSGGSTSFHYAPGIGVKLGEKFDANLKYLGYSRNNNSISAIGLRLAYTFN